MNKKIELLKTITSLGQLDIEEAFKGREDLDHLIQEYTKFRNKDDRFGNFTFLMSRDNEHAAMLFKHIGLGYVEFVGKGKGKFIGADKKALLDSIDGHFDDANDDIIDCIKDEVENAVNRAIDDLHSTIKKKVILWRSPKD